MSEDSYSTTLYTVCFTNFPITSTGGASFFDVWNIKAPSNSRVEIHEFNLGQLSSATANNQQIGIQVLRGSTALGGGATVTPVNLKGWSAAQTAGTSATAPSSNLASTASAVVVISDNSDFSGNWYYRPDTYEEIVLDKGQSLNVRVSAPPVTVQLSGTLIIKEIATP